MNAVCPKCQTSTSEPTCPKCGFCISCFESVVKDLKTFFPQASDRQIERATNRVRSKYQTVKE